MQWQQCKRRVGDGEDRLARAISEGEVGAGESPTRRRFLRALQHSARRGKIRLPVVSETVARVIQLMDNPDVEIDELTRCVELDPSLATKVMGVANSSFFRGASAVLNVREALMRMGVREARTIVVVVALRSTVLRAPGVGEFAQALWRHSLLAALVAQELLANVPPWQQAGFLLGLVHDIGRIVVLGFADGLLEEGWKAEALAREMIEEASDCVHAELGALVLDSWGFAQACVDAVRHHHVPGAHEGAQRALIQAVHASDLLAHCLERGWPEGAETFEPDLAVAFEQLSVDFETASEIATEAAAGYEALSRFG